MGESIFEGTITKWLKKPGEKVQRDEPLFEISTDKVDAEIPAPASGILKEIKVPEGTTVQVNTVVGVLDADGAGAAAPAPQPAKAAGSTRGGAASTEGPAQPPSPVAQSEGTSTKAQPQATEAAARRSAGKPTAPNVVTPAPGEEETEVPTQLRGRPGVEPASRSHERAAVARQQETVIEFPQAGEGEERIRSSPLVRRIARDNNVNLAEVAGTGLGGRITKQDILQFVEKHGAGAPVPARPAAAAVAPGRPAYQPGTAAPAMPGAAAEAAVIPGEIVPMTPMRRKIAERMIESRRTSAHVHNMFEVDLTRIVQLRNREKTRFEQQTGSRLTFMPFFARAAMSAIRQFPIVNASVEGENLHYHREVNLGIAVALDWGLIVPIVKNGEEKNFLGLQRSITDLAERARTKKLKPEEVQGGTFTITNPGSYGAVFGLPIIMQPQVAILGVGAITKMPIVITDEEGIDSIAIRSIVHLVLGYDHRVIDGAVADQFMSVVKKNLENWSEGLV
jgi:2-oxoglutarate dehydrogenase E2 component (dihydrolipoamide succinyltransferase)